MPDSSPAVWSGPLAGLKVLDFTRVLAGPLATQFLGDLGAEVFKVEPPGGGDETRSFAPFREGESHYFVAINRSKKGLVVDLKSAGGRQVALDLFREVDVLVENYRPGVMAKLGLDYEAASAINPRLIYCSISGFGQTGPMRDRPSFDIVTQALSGAMSVNGERGGTPVRLGLPFGDMVGGVFGPMAILAALHERHTTGRGRLIDIALLDGLMGMLAYLPQQYLFSGADPVPTGSSHAFVVPYGAFQAQDGPILIACLANAFWGKLMTAIGRPELTDHPDYATMVERQRNRTAVDKLINDAIGSRTVAEWAAILDAADVPNAPVQKMSQMLTHPQILARGMVDAVDHATLGRLPVVGRVIKFPGEDQAPLAPPPVYGEHTTTVLRDVLGYSEAQIDALIASGAIQQN